MPLPFLTADRAFEADADDIALPYDDHDQWRRPYRPGPYRVGGAALLLLLASFVLLSATIIVFAAELTSGLIVLGIGVATVACALRLLRMGVWVSGAGMRRVGFLSTVTVPWEQTQVVRTVQQPVRWLGLPRAVQGQALVMERRGGSPLPPLLTDHNADFLSRPEAFDRAADTVEAWGAEYRR
ncbi:hypothetical protein [Streptomyces candidus]|uniref:PH domain-containing protein n=1 Tax=Streptomyces candidus TaxID=67283 RepID=A0A7X0LRS5_9ACTN|nr:hypothetical protein [Streptomyces candidus]MBB6438450.1 hypothetical protein [Streptomyces candidus]GHH52433.1 membrane protein [Streptomyces candidus]